MLALERPDAVAIIDDKLARRVAETLRIKFTGTLGVLLDAKRSGLIEAVAPWLDRLEELRFRLSARARAALLREAGELR
jgi:predicted nucleic acid-binding protein